MKALLSIFIFIAISLSATSQNYFWNHYGGEGGEVANHVQQTSDLGFILTGRGSGTGDDTSNGLNLVKTDPEGNEEWSQTYTNTGVHLGTCVRQTADSGYIASGLKNGDAFDGDTLSLTKVDSDGIEEWTKTYDLLTFGYGENLIITEDGGFMITGHIAVDYDQHVKVIKTDSQGNIIWSQIYESQNDQFTESIVRTNDGGYALCGDGWGIEGSILLIKIDEDGELIWEQHLSDSEGSGECYSLDTTPDNGFVVLGTTYFAADGGSDRYLLIKTNDEGVEEWHNTYYSHDGARGYDVKSNGSDGFIMTGYAIDNAETAYLMYCIKTDPSGNTEWEQIFVEWHSSRGWSSTVTEDGGFAFAGTAKITDFWWQAYLVKTNSSGTLSIDNPESASSRTTVYPNPFSNSATIFLSLSADKKFNLRVLDSRGKAVRSLENVSYMQTFDRGSLESGIYYYQVLEDGEYYDSGKFIIQ